MTFGVSIRAPSNSSISYTAEPALKSTLPPRALPHRAAAAVTARIDCVDLFLSLSVIRRERERSISPADLARRIYIQLSLSLYLSSPTPPLTIY